MDLDEGFYGGSFGELDDYGGIAGAMESHRQALLKATTALQGGTTYVTDPPSLTGGGALRMQSIEPILQRTIPTDEHFPFYNRIAQSDANPVDEYTVYDDIGGFLGGSFQGEIDDIVETEGNYERKVLRVKIMATMRQISLFLENQKSFIEVQGNEALGAISVLKRDCNYNMYYGDETVVPNEFNGLEKAILDKNDPELIIDAGGEGLDSGGGEILSLSRAIHDDGRFGLATDLWCSPLVQLHEFDRKLDPSIRVSLNSIGPAGIMLGTPVPGVRAGRGPVKNNEDIFIKEGQAPWEGASAKLQARVVALALTPATIASTVAATGTAANKFQAKHAGLYYWGVEATSRKGNAPTAVSAQVAVAAGQKVTFTITNPADANVTGYIIHRSRKNGANAKSDLRKMVRIPRTAGATTVYVDENQNVPGTSTVFVGDFRPSDTGINLRRMGTMRRFALYPTNKLMRPWAHFFFAGLRVSKPLHFGMVRNVLPGGALWKPFN